MFSSISTFMTKRLKQVSCFLVILAICTKTTIGIPPEERRIAELPVRGQISFVAFDDRHWQYFDDAGDVAFERGWAMNAQVYTLKKDAVDIVKKRYRSTISSGPKVNYRNTKLFWLKRTPTALFRGTDYLARARYALR